MSTAKATGSEEGHDDHRTVPELSGHCLSTAKMNGSEKSHDDHITAPEHPGHSLGSARVTGPPKRILLPYERRLGDCNITMLL